MTKQIEFIHKPFPVPQRANFTLKDIDQVYVGKGGCACGCGGNYYRLEDNEYRPGFIEKGKPAQVKRVVTRFKKQVEEGTPVYSQDNYIFEVETSPETRPGDHTSKRLIRIYLKKK